MLMISCHERWSIPCPVSNTNGYTRFVGKDNEDDDDDDDDEDKDDDDEEDDDEDETKDEEESDAYMAWLMYRMFTIRTVRANVVMLLFANMHVRITDASCCGNASTFPSVV